MQVPQRDVAGIEFEYAGGGRIETALIRSSSSSGRSITRPAEIEFTQPWLPG